MPSWYSKGSSQFHMIQSGHRYIYWRTVRAIVNFGPSTAGISVEYVGELVISNQTTGDRCHLSFKDKGRCVTGTIEIHLSQGISGRESADTGRGNVMETSTPRQAMRPTVFPSLLANWMETKMRSRRQIHVAGWTSSWWREAIGMGPCRKKKLRLLPRRKRADTKSDFRVINDMPPTHLPTAQLDLIYRARTNRNSSSTFRLANTGIARVGKIGRFVLRDHFN